MTTTYMGYESKLYYGTANATAATLITNARDVKYSIGNKKAPTTVKGSGSSPPIEVERVVGLTASITWQMTDKSGDTTLTALIAAAAAGTVFALRTLPHSGGTGYDGDVTVSCEVGQPYQGENTFDFTATPNDDNRTPLLNV